MLALRGVEVTCERDGADADRLSLKDCVWRKPVTEAIKERNITYKMVMQQ